MADLHVGRTTARFIQDGHPWVRPDRFTFGLDRLRAGDVVTLMDENGRGLASALADPTAEACARVFHRLPGKTFDPAAAIKRAWDRRAALHADPDTTVYRIVHGEADFIPGLRVERYGDVLVVEVRCDAIARYADAVATALAGLMPAARIVIKDHRDDLRRSPVANRMFDGDEASRAGARRSQDVDPSRERRAPARLFDADEVVTVRELGVTLHARPFAGLATGIYLDQRATRAWLRPTIVGAKVLNLFAYTGAFSASLLAAGAAESTDVDVAAPALAIATANAEANGVADRHAAIQSDCGGFLAASNRTWDLIIIDPPTSALGDGSWVLRRDYPALLRLAWSRLAPGGRLVACCNTIHGKPFPLIETLVVLGGERWDTPSLADDVPLLKGFPEGRPYQLAAVRRLS